MCRFSIGAALSQQSFCNCLLLFLFSFFAFIVVVVCCYYCCCFCFCYCRAVHFSLNRRIVFCVSCSCFFVIFIFYAFALCSSVLCSAYTNTFISSNSFLFLNFFLSDMRFFFLWQKFSCTVLSVPQSTACLFLWLFIVIIIICQ